MNSARGSTKVYSFLAPLCLSFCTVFSFVLPAASDTLNIVEYPIATSPTAFETTPTLGNDGSGNLVVYTVKQVRGDGLLDQGDIWYQRLNGDGSPPG